MAKLLVLHGPNLNLLGQREPDIYGRTTLPEIDAMLRGRADRDGHSLTCRQSNAEHELVGWVQSAAAEGIDLILLNPAAFTHTSVALRDALAAARVPFIEIHLSNPQAREPFRHRSLVSDLALGTIAGFGAVSYRLALEAACEHLQSRPNPTN